MRVKSFTSGQRVHDGERGARGGERGAVSAGRGVAWRGDTPLLGTRGARRGGEGRGDIAAPIAPEKVRPPYMDIIIPPTNPSPYADIIIPT